MKFARYGIFTGKFLIDRVPDLVVIQKLFISNKYYGQAL